MAIFTGTTPSIGGSELLAGGAFTTTVAIVGVTVGMTVSVTPETYPGDGVYWSGFVSAPGVVTVKVGTTIAGFVGASVYDVQVSDGAAAGGVTAVTGAAPITSTGGSTPQIGITNATNANVGAVKPDNTTITVAAGVLTAAAGAAPAVTAVTGTAPIASTGGLTPAISIATGAVGTKGAVSPDGTTITAAAGVLTAAAGATPAVTAVTGTAPIASTGGLTPAISIATAAVGTLGACSPDGTTITAAAGVLTAVSSGAADTGAEITSAANTSVANNTTTTLVMATVTRDDGGFTGTANTLTVPAGKAGWYIITANVDAKTATNVNLQYVILAKNGAQIVPASGFSAAAGDTINTIDSSVAYVTHLAVGDAITIQVFQTNAGAGAIAYQSILSMARIN